MSSSSSFTAARLQNVFVEDDEHSTDDATAPWVDIPLDMELFEEADFEESPFAGPEWFSNNMENDFWYEMSPEPRRVLSPDSQQAQDTVDGILGKKPVVPPLPLTFPFGGDVAKLVHLPVVPLTDFPDAELPIRCMLPEGAGRPPVFFHYFRATKSLFMFTDVPHDLSMNLAVALQETEGNVFSGGAFLKALHERISDTMSMREMANEQEPLEQHSDDYEPAAKRRRLVEECK